MEREKNIDRQSLAPIASGTDEAASNAAGVGETHAAGRVHLVAPSAAGGVTAELHARLAAAFALWSKQPVTYCAVIEGEGDAFSLDWDLPLIARTARAEPAAATRLLAGGYGLAWQLDCFTKPTIALIDGGVSGAGAGMSLFGTHRVAGERFRFAVPGPRRGWFPDHGLAHVLASLAGHVGVYLALTGASIGRVDAYQLGLVTHCIAARHFDHITRCLSDADPVDPLLDDMNEVGGTGELAPRAEAIARCFSADSIDQIVARLGQERGAAATWAQQVARDLAAASPLALAITLRHVRTAARFDLRDTLIQDFRVASRLAGADDLAAACAAGTGPVAWPSRTPDGPSPDAVSAYLATLGAQDLQLATRAQMQAPVL